MIARIDPVNWKRSKRIQWFEKWIASSVEREDMVEGVVKAMWGCGVKLRNAMGEVTGSTDGKGGSRGYIDEFVAQTRTPVRPERVASQESHVQEAERWMSSSDKGDEREREGSDAESIKTIRKRFPPATPPPMTGPATPDPKTNEKAPAQKKLPTRYIPSIDFFGRVQKSFHENDSRTLLNPAAAAQTTPTAPPRRPVSSIYSQQQGGNRVASSIYSRATDDDGEDERWESREDWFRNSVLEEEEFIDSYGTGPKGSSEVKKDERGFI